MPDWYTHTTYPSTSASLASSPMRAELDAIANSFAKLPDYSGNALKIIAVNVGGSAYEAVSSTGTGSVARANSPAFVTPTLGVASATSINKNVFTATATSCTWTLADGKTFTCSNTITIAGTDGASLNIGAGGTLGSGAYATVTGSNTGDETTATIKTKLSITTLSGSNTGDQTSVSGSSGSCTGNAATATLATTATTATSATKLATTNFTCEEVGGVLKFKYGSTVIATLDSSGNFKAKADNGANQTIS